MTPEGIRQYQENEPYPDWETIYKESMPDSGRLIDDFISLDDEVYQSFANLEAYKTYRENQAKNLASGKVSRGTMLSWSTLRKLVWLRDDERCDVCGNQITWEMYHCGHIVDRVCGGSDRLDNLVVMCNYCNLFRKDLHETKEQYIEWRDNRTWQKQERAMIAEMITELGFTQEQLEAAWRQFQASHADATV